MDKNSNITMEELVNFCKQYGFVFQGSEIYNGLANSWDYGTLGRELKNNIKNAWWKRFIQENHDKNYKNFGLDSAIIMNPEVWVASGHVASFADPLIDCKKCKARHRADKLIEDFTQGKETGDGWSNEKLENFIKDNNVPCPKCGNSDFTPIRKFNLLFESHIGVTEDSKSKVYLRGETAQGALSRKEHHLPAQRHRSRTLRAPRRLGLPRAVRHPARAAALLLHRPHRLSEEPVGADPRGGAKAGAGQRARQRRGRPRAE